jgi:hypothetical protein
VLGSSAAFYLNQEKDIMLEACITIRGTQLKQLIVDGLALAGVSATADNVYLSYDAGCSGDPRDSGAGATASISTVLSGQKVNLPKTENELEALVKAALEARGYKFARLGVSFGHSSGDRSGDSGDTYAHAFVELPDRLIQPVVSAH